MPFGAAAFHKPMPRESFRAAAAAGSARGARGGGEDAGGLRQGEGLVPGRGARGEGQVAAQSPLEV